MLPFCFEMFIVLPLTMKRKQLAARPLCFETWLETGIGVAANPRAEDCYRWSSLVLPGRVALSVILSASCKSYQEWSHPAFARDSYSRPWPATFALLRNLLASFITALFLLQINLIIQSNIFKFLI